jgi:3-deoxy-D-manno-octulosonic-acid transferase
MPILAGLLLVLTVLRRPYRQAFAQRCRDWLQGPQAYPSGTDVIWVHGSSVGECLMAESLAQALKQVNPNLKVVLTFFSPSAGAWKALKTFRFVDQSLYLFFVDSLTVRRIFKILKPRALVLVQGELWPELVDQALQNRTKVCWAHPRRAPSRWLKSFVRDIDLVTVDSAQLASQIRSYGASSVKLCEPLVLAAARERLSTLKTPSLKSQSPLLVAGSVWFEDAQLLAETLATAFESKIVKQALIVPHDVSPENCKAILLCFQQRGLESRLVHNVSDCSADAPVQILAQMGVLAGLYSKADFCFVGRSPKGLHNVAEVLASNKRAIFRADLQTPHWLSLEPFVSQCVPVRNGADFLMALKTSAQREQSAQSNDLLNIAQAIGSLALIESDKISK